MCKRTWIKQKKGCCLDATAFIRKCTLSGTACQSIVSLSLSFSISVPLSLCLSVCLSVCLYLSLSVSRSLCLSLFLPLPSTFCRHSLAVRMPLIIREFEFWPALHLPLHDCLLRLQPGRCARRAESMSRRQEEEQGGVSNSMCLFDCEPLCVYLCYVTRATLEKIFNFVFQHRKEDQGSGSADDGN